MAKAHTNDCHAMAVNHIADAVCEYTCFNSLAEIRAQSNPFRKGCRIISGTEFLGNLWY